MASYSTNEFKGGLKIMLDGDPCSIIENEFVKPGKGHSTGSRFAILKPAGYWKKLSGPVSLLRVLMLLN